MSDRPPGGPPATTPNPDPPDPNAPANPPTQRTFFSGVAAGEFFENLQVVLDFASQEVLFTRMSETVTALTGLVERLLAAVSIPQGPALQAPASNPASQTPSIQRQSPPPIPERPSSIPPANPYRSPYRSPPPTRDPPLPAPPPVREPTAFTFATAETAASTYGGGISGITLPKFTGKDGENVVAWLHQLESFLDAVRVNCRRRSRIRNTIVELTRNTQPRPMVVVSPASRSPNSLARMEKTWWHGY